jgi:hypothetical protein
LLPFGKKKSLLKQFLLLNANICIQKISWQLFFFLNMSAQKYVLFTTTKNPEDTKNRCEKLYVYIYLYIYIYIFKVSAVWADAF